MFTVSKASLPESQRIVVAEQGRPTVPVAPVPLAGIARLAARLLGAPMGAVTYAGGQYEHFAGSYGLRERPPPLTRALSRYVTAADAPVRCADLADTEIGTVLPARYGVHAFAGVPLCDDSGHPVGALLV